MIDRPGSARVNPDALRQFADRMSRQLATLQTQLNALRQLQERTLPLGATAMAREQAVRHEEVCMAYQQELSRLSVAYAEAVELTEVLLHRYGIVDQAAREVIEQSYGRLDAATRDLGR